MNPFPYQLEGVKFLCDRPMPSKSALLADSMGLGKSCQAILACDKLQAKKIIVVCPAGLRRNWAREFESWGDTPRRIQIIEKGTDLLQDNANLLIVSYDLLGKGYVPGCPNNLLRNILRHKFDVVIFDEAHYMKDIRSLRTKAMLSAQGLIKVCTYKFFLTGTPVLNRPIELYAMMKACVPLAIDPYTTYRKFAERFCGGHVGRFNEYWDRGATNVEDLAERLQMSGFMLRREKKDVLKELPERFLQLISLDLADEDKPLIEKEFNLHTKYSAKGQMPPMEEMSVIRHELARAKMPAILAYVRDVLESKQKVVIFAHHRDIIEGLMYGLKEFGRVKIDGSTPMKVRETSVLTFQNDPDCRIFVGQIQAAGTGITLTASDHVIFAELSWVPGEVNQCIDRTHRIGQTKPVTAQFLVAAGSLEEQMIKQLVDKTLVINKLIN